VAKLVEITAISQKGHYAAGHKIGNKIIFDFGSNEIKGKICLYVCPDTYNPVVFEVRHKEKD